MTVSEKAVGELIFWYRNYRGEEGYRRVRPISLRFGTSEYHKEPQWLLRALDLEKNAQREFSLADAKSVVGRPVLDFAADLLPLVGVERREGATLQERAARGGAPNVEPPCAECGESAPALRAEVARLNEWAEGFSDAQLKERRLCEARIQEMQRHIDKLSLALMMISEGCANPAKFASERLAALSAQSGSGVEREDVARAIYEAELEDCERSVPWPEAFDSDKAQYYRQADAVIALLPKHTVQPVEGWQLVPKIPTQEMVSAAQAYKAKNTTRAWEGDYEPTMAELYRVMLSAAPTSPHEVQERETKVVKPVGGEGS